MNKILFVCIGNICRSPIAEGLLRHALPDRAICSAGVGAMRGYPADPLSVQIMQEQGIDISTHRAQSLAAWMVLESDLIITMDLEQQAHIESLYPASKGKVKRLGEDYDVPDPYQLGLASFRHAFNLISQGVDRLAGQLAPVVPPTTDYGFQSIWPMPTQIWSGAR